jgi:predicted ATP-grasp superfamily ATP-dependent carboligase
MVQELIPGNGETQVSFAALCDDGRPLAWLTARRMRQYPVDFGRFNTCVETVDLPEFIACGNGLHTNRLSFTTFARLERRRIGRQRVMP